ncbi:tRNA:m(4)X modification enzyme TRM13 homolog [Aplysia californica]|uniref:tRNA:m(4)X modification enzyme TRM13 n=1 Tax=Aplysia californica TaxID=6500 RepID=A0ABM0JYK5_APLCA|nr:tRNA:m(4)X modification enzyme TRM13 homolog [Aplysia californica]
MAKQENKGSGCKFYLEKKKRFCRFAPKPGVDYCQEHACILGIEIDRKRIPCPLDPSHNCYADKLQKHLKKCNVTKLRKVTEEAEFFSRGINMGPTVDVPTEQKNISVREVTSEQLAALIEKVKKLYEAHVDKPETVILEHPCVKTEYNGKEEANNEAGESTELKKTLEENPGLRKELLQQASLVAQLDSLSLLDKINWFVELGAGKGKLSHWVEKAYQGNEQASYLLVDRSSVRYKMDSFHKEDSGASKFKRIKVDIADLCLGYVSDVRPKDSVVVMGKHLCGGATDLGIRCAVDSLGIRRSGDEGKSEAEASQEPPAKAQKLVAEDDGAEKGSSLPRGIMIALCCHHRCDWATYVGREFMQNCGVTPVEFDLLTRLSSWATCARGKWRNFSKDSADATDSPKDLGPQEDRKDNAGEIDADEQPGDHVADDLVTSKSSNALRESLSVTVRENIGRKCKRLIDTGRLHYLRSKGMTCCLREYVSGEITPENVVLLAHCEPVSSSPHRKTTE